MIKSFLFLVLFAVVSSASDTVTIGRLEWQDDSAAKTVERDYSGAKAYCEALTLAGKSDWRLPTIKELQSIVDINRYKPAIKSSFKNVASECYWSSSFRVSYSRSAWFVDFEDGKTGSYNSADDDLYVRCVRGRQ